MCEREKEVGVWPEKMICVLLTYEVKNYGGREETVCAFAGLQFLFMVCGNPTSEK